MRFKVHLLAASAILCLHAQAGASTWYVSNTGNNATAAKDKPANPWQTLGGLVASVKKSGVKFAAGDKIVLTCGGIWRESLEIDSSIADGGISIEAQPSCTVKPSIRGSEALDQPTWSRTGTTGPYFTNWLLPEAPAQVFSIAAKGKQVHTLARYPNIGSDLNKYASVKPTSDVSSIQLDTQTTALMKSNFPDSELVVRVRAEAWKVYSAKFKSFVASTGVLTLDRPPFSVGDFPNENRVDDGDGVVLENKLWLMDADKEWYYKPGASNAAGALYMVQGNVSTLPTYKGLEATVRSSILTFRGLNDVKVTGIDLRHSKGSALEIVDGSGATVDSVDISHAAVAPLLLDIGQKVTSCGEVSALYIGPSLDKDCQFTAPFPSDAVVIHSTFNNNGMSAVKVYADATKTEGTLVYDNKVSNTGTVAYTDNVLGAVIVSGDGATVTINTITDSAYNAIVFGRRGEIITANAIQNYCVRYADCGAIYAFNIDNAVPPQGKLAADISQNWINNTKASYDARYAYQGLPASFERDQIAAIYLDNRTNHVRINKNYIDYAGIGVFSNGGYKNEISENWLHGMFNTGFKMSDQNDTTRVQGYLRGNIVRDNVVYAYDRVLINDTVGGVTTSLNPPLHAVGRAQYWYSFTETVQGKALFEDNPKEVVGSDFFAANRVTGNKVIEISNRSKQWRVGHTIDKYNQPEVSLGAWKSLSGSTDVLFRPVSRRLVNVAGIPIKTASLTSDFETDDRTWSFADGTFSIASGVKGCVSNCAKLNFAPDSPGNGFVVSNGYPLNVQSKGDFLHYEYFTAGATGSSLAASSLANVQVVVNESVVNAQSEGDWSKWLGTGTPGVLEGRWAEDFHLPASFATGQRGNFWIYGNKGATTYVDGVRVTRIPANGLSATNVFDPTSPYVSALFFNNNAVGSGINETFDCPGRVPCVDQNGGVFQTNFVLTPGQSKMVFKQVDTTFAR
jgi:hypothetical protein